MSKYRVSSAKPQSAVKKYEFIRERGYIIEGPNGQVLLKGQALDDYLTEQIWREKHPGQEPIKEWDDGLPA